LGYLGVGKNVDNLQRQSNERYLRLEKHEKQLGSLKKELSHLRGNFEESRENIARIESNGLEPK
jgi:hypothetical protein